MTDEHSCITCAVLFPARPKPHHYERPHVCESCRRKVAVTLAEIPRLCRELPAAFPRKRRPQINGSRVNTTPQPSEPLDWRPYDLSLPADARKRELLARGFLGDDPEAEYQDNVLSVATELDGMVRDWLTYLDENPPAATVGRSCAWLADRWDWACGHHPAVDEFAGDVVALARSVRSAVGSGPTGESVGRCPAVLRDGTRCQARLWAEVVRRDEQGQGAGFLVQCARCGSSWDRGRSEWVALAAAQEAAGLARWQAKTSA